MQRYVAFLRAINVGGHIVTMDRLRERFKALPVAGVDPVLLLYYHSSAQQPGTIRIL